MFLYVTPCVTFVVDFYFYEVRENGSTFSVANTLKFIFKSALLRGFTNFLYTFRRTNDNKIKNTFLFNITGGAAAPTGEPPLQLY